MLVETPTYFLAVTFIAAGVDFSGSSLDRSAFFGIEATVKKI